ncbi:ABC transporter permease, partial [Paenibacillus sepulcri]|nr:ABC transporter permease [Paenibacillus sepulcri]
MKDTVMVSPKPKFAFKSGLQQFLAFGSLILMIVFFSLASSNFFHFSNMVGILLSTAVIGVLALGSTFVIVTGGIDLSVGTVMTLCAVMTGVFITMWGLPVPVGIIGGLLTGALCGLISGVVIARLGIPPFIATLAMMMIAKGLALVISGTKPVYFTDTPVFMEISQGSLLGELIPGFDIPN